MRAPGRVPAGVWHVGVPLVLAVFYLTTWSPLRVWGAVHVMRPLFAEVVAPGCAVRPVVPGKALAAVECGSVKHTASVPLGRSYLMSALVLAAVRPRRWLWLRLSLVLGPLGLVSVALTAAGAAGAGWAWVLDAFLQGYVIFPLGVGLTMWWLLPPRFFAGALQPPQCPQLPPTGAANPGLGGGHAPHRPPG